MTDVPIFVGVVSERIFPNDRRVGMRDDPFGDINAVDGVALVFHGNMAKEESEVKWAMKFTADWIRIHEPKHRKRCVELGVRLGPCKDLPVAKNRYAELSRRFYSYLNCKAEVAKERCTSSLIVSCYVQWLVADWQSLRRPGVY